MLTKDCAGTLASIGGSTLRHLHCRQYCRRYEIAAAPDRDKALGSRYAMPRPLRGMWWRLFLITSRSIGSRAGSQTAYSPPMRSFDCCNERGTILLSFGAGTIFTHRALTYSPRHVADGRNSFLRFRRVLPLVIVLFEQAFSRASALTSLRCPIRKGAVGDKADAVCRSNFRGLNLARCRVVLPPLGNAKFDFRGRPWV